MGRDGLTLTLRGAGSEEEEEEQEGQGDGRAGGGVGDVSWVGITDHIRSGLLSKPLFSHSISVPLAGNGLPALCCKLHRSYASPRFAPSEN